MLHPLKTSEVCKGRRALFDKELASRAGLHFLQAGEKVVSGDLQSSQIRGRRALGFNRQRREEAAQSDHPDFLAQRFEIGADEAVGVLSDLFEIDVAGQRHGARVNFKNLQPRLRIGNPDFDFTIEASGTPQRRVKNLGNVGSAHNNDLAA